MAKYCVLARKVTNCTDNCRVCLEEEEKVRDIKVGDKVRYIFEDSKEDKETGFYPPKGTVGTVIGIEDSYFYLIRWPEGTTKDDGCWYAKEEDIELVENFD